MGSETVRSGEARKYMVRKRYLETFSEEVLQPLQGQSSMIGRARAYTFRPPLLPKNHFNIGLEDTSATWLSAEPFPAHTVTNSLSDETEIFWDPMHSGMSTTDAGVKLILAVKVARESGKLGVPLETKSEN